MMSSAHLSENPAENRIRANKKHENKRLKNVKIKISNVENKILNLKMKVKKKK